MIFGSFYLSTYYIYAHINTHTHTYTHRISFYLCMLIFLKTDHHSVLFFAPSFQVSLGKSWLLRSLSLPWILLPSLTTHPLSLPDRSWDNQGSSPCWLWDGLWFDEVLCTRWRPRPAACAWGKGGWDFKGSTEQAVTGEGREEVIPGVPRNLIILDSWMDS